MHSHHSHSGQFCSHAKDQLADILERAHSLGFTHFHLSEHCPRQSADHLYPEEVEAGLSPIDLDKKFTAYIAHARSLQEVWKGKLNILVGCETENLNTEREGDGDSLEFLSRRLESLSVRNGKLREGQPAGVGQDVIDYMVGSLHHVRGIPIDFDVAHFEKAVATFEEEADKARLTPEQRQDIGHARLILEYLDRQLELMQRLRPEVIGHFDLFRLYRPDFPIKPDPQAPRSHLDGLLQDVWSRIERNVRYTCAYGALFEANSASLRKGWETGYPGVEILESILSHGGRICLSDDSHGIDYVALNYTRLKQYLVLAGVEEIWYLEADPDGQLTDKELLNAAEESVAARAAAPGPCKNAPVRFARGTIARKTDATWQDHACWSNIQLPVT